MTAPPSRPLVNEPPELDKRSFWALVPVVFQSNFNDNLFRMVVWLFLGAYAASHHESKDVYRTLTGICLAAPYAFLSLFAGQMADRFSKRAVLVWVKVAETAILFVGSLVLALGGHPYITLGILALLGTRYCLFGPSTYGMIPELMPAGRLAWANGWIEGMTFLGAILGTALGGLLFDIAGARADLPLLILGLISFAGWASALVITPLPAAAPGRKLALFPKADFIHNLRCIRETTGMMWAIIGVVAWWLMAALALQTAMKMAEDALGLSGFGTSRFFIYVGLGVALGSHAAGRLSGDRIDLRLVPIGGYLMGLAAILVWTLPRTEFWTGLGVSASGFFSGLFVVPLKAYIQHMAPLEYRGGILGAANFFQYMAIFVAVGPSYYLLTEVFRLTGGTMFLIIGLVALGVATVSLYVLPGAQPARLQSKSAG